MLVSAAAFGEALAAFAASINEARDRRFGGTDAAYDHSRHDRDALGANFEITAICRLVGWTAIAEVVSRGPENPGVTVEVATRSQFHIRAMIGRQERRLASNRMMSPFVEPRNVGERQGRQQRRSEAPPPQGRRCPQRRSQEQRPIPPLRLHYRQRSRAMEGQAARSRPHKLQPHRWQEQRQSAQVCGRTWKGLKHRGGEKPQRRVERTGERCPPQLRAHPRER